jgi:hypothetical protein
MLLSGGVHNINVDADLSAKLPKSKNSQNQPARADGRADGTAESNFLEIENDDNGCASWSDAQVQTWILTVEGVGQQQLREYSAKLKAQDIDGLALTIMTTNELVGIIGSTFGHTVKIAAARDALVCTAPGLPCLTALPWYYPLCHR